VPYVRGPEVSAPLDVIIAQALYYQRHCFNEITLLGQNVLSYGSDFGFSPSFAEMVEAVLEETQIPWVSFLTSQPYDMSDEVIARVIAHPRITPLLHLPVQSGSDSVLECMRRGYTAAAYIEWAQKARTARTGLFLTTDFVCGFPGETDEDFAQTLALAERVRFNDAFTFAFSPREGTPAAGMDGQLPPKVRKERLAALIELQRRIAHEVNTSYIGQVMDAIVEENTPKRAVVRTAFNKPVSLAQCSRAPGQFTRVRITAVAVSSFKGEEAL
jgi:tRNA-2-methylthio-N6-dimethylallyladenosine synthase